MKTIIVAFSLSVASLNVMAAITNPNDSKLIVHVTTFSTGGKSLQGTQTFDLGVSSASHCQITKHLWTTPIILNDQGSAFYGNVYLTKAAGSLDYTCAQETYTTNSGYTTSIKYQLTNDGITYERANPHVQVVTLK